MVAKKKSIPAKKKTSIPAKNKTSALAKAEKHLINTAVPEKEAESLSALGKKILKDSIALKSIRSSKDREGAVAMLKASKEFVKRVELFFKEPVQKAKDTVESAKATLKSVKERESALSKHVDEAIEILTESIKSFDKKEIERQNKLAEAKAKEQADKLVEDQRKANETVQEAVASGDVEKIEDAQRQADAVPVSVSVSAPITSFKSKNSVSSSSSRLVYKAELVNLEAFVTAVVEGKLPKSLLDCLDVARISIIQNYADSHQLPEGNTVEGFKITKDISLRTS